MDDKHRKSHDLGDLRAKKKRRQPPLGKSQVAGVRFVRIGWIDVRKIDRSWLF